VLANKKHSKAPEQPFKEGPEQMHAKSDLVNAND